MPAAFGTLQCVVPHQTWGNIMHPNPFYLAVLETPHFTFQCVAESEHQAHDRMSAAWNTHRRQTGATATWAEMRDDMNITEIEIGQVYRDGRRVRS